MKEKQENTFLNLILNIILPNLILIKGGDYWPESSPIWANVALALSFPLSYGVYDFITRKKYNFFSILGFISVLLTGGFAISDLNPIWFAIKEAAIPLIFGIAVLASMFTKYPLVKVLLFNKSIIEVEKVYQSLTSKGNAEKFGKLLNFCSYLLSFSFLLSAILNFGLARYLVNSPAGTETRTKEIGEMGLYSWPIIMIPMMVISGIALYKLISGITRMSGLTMEEIIKQRK